jgi:[1-hydroxy-2-(trimethylamino)ethyl]phosphonate dioxygenase
MSREDLSPQNLSPDTIVAFLGDIVQRRGADSYLGEPVTIGQHMLQAAHLAQAEGAGEDLVAAALLHDIGHYTGEFGDDYIEQGVDNHHDEAGGQVLERFFPPLVTDCVRLHVAAKRYLCAADPAYFGKLSDASVKTLALQGGPMSARGGGRLPQPPPFQGGVRVRLWDEAAKEPDLRVRASPASSITPPCCNRSSTATAAEQLHVHPAARRLRPPGHPLPLHERADRGGERRGAGVLRAHRGRHRVLLLRRASPRC